VGSGIEVLGGSTSLPLRLTPHSAHVAITPFCCHGFPDKIHRRRARQGRLRIPAGRTPHVDCDSNALVKPLCEDTSKTY
jgi:hypothetical protein